MKKKQKRAASDGGVDIDKFISAVNKASKSAVASLGTGRHASDIPGYISTGIWPLDVYLGRGRFRGGYPIGKIHEVFGPESSGKTTLGIHAMIAVQRGHITLSRWEVDEQQRLHEEVDQVGTKPGIVVFLETEKMFDKVRAQALGLDLQKVVWLKANSVEQAFSRLKRIIEVIRADPKLKGVATLLVWDTLAASPTEREAEGKSATPGGQANAISAGLRQLVDPLADSWMTLLLINQTRSKIGVMFGNPETTSGGAAPKFYSTLRMRTSPGKKVLVQGAAVGFQQRLSLQKSRVTVPFATFSVPLMYQTGIDDDLALAWYLTDATRFDQSTVPVFAKGAGFATLLGDGTEISASATEWRALLDQHPEVRTRLRQAVIDAWEGATTPAGRAAEEGEEAEQPTEPT